MTQYARTSREHYKQIAEELKEEIEDLMLIKSLTSGAQLTVRVLDYSWQGSVVISVELEGVDSFSIYIDSHGYKFIANSGTVRDNLYIYIRKNSVMLKSREALLQTVKRFAV